MVVTSDKTIYHTGEIATYRIKTTDHLGTPLSAQVVLSLVDVALLDLLPDNNVNLVDAFYPSSIFPYRDYYPSVTVGVSSGLLINGEQRPKKMPMEPTEEGQGGDGYGIDDGIPLFDFLAREMGRASGQGHFEDTAWSGMIQTDEHGEATVTITLPDNVTTWRIVARAMSAHNLVGQTTNEISVRNE